MRSGLPLEHFGLIGYQHKRKFNNWLDLPSALVYLRQDGTTYPTLFYLSPPPR